MPLMIIWTVVGISCMVVFGVDDLVAIVKLFAVSAIVALIVRCTMTGYHEAIQRRIAATTGKPMSVGGCEKAANLVADVVLWGGPFTGGVITALGVVYAVWCFIGIIRCDSAVSEIHRERMDAIRSNGQTDIVHELPAPSTPPVAVPIGSVTY